MSPALVTMSPESMKENRDTVESQYQKGVKHLCENGVRSVPRKYILPVSERPNYAMTGKPYATETANFELPVIDFAQLQGSNRDQVLISLAKACESYGFFQVGYERIYISTQIF
jgi:hypothetical protein